MVLCAWIMTFIITIPPMCPDRGDGGGGGGISQGLISI